MDDKIKLLDVRFRDMRFSAAVQGDLILIPLSIKDPRIYDNTKKEIARIVSSLLFEDILSNAEKYPDLRTLARDMYCAAVEKVVACYDEF